MRSRPRGMREGLKANLERVLDRMREAAARAGRSPDAVRLVAVTKKAPLPLVRLLAELGQVDLGENRPERIPGRAEALSMMGLYARWHMIGHYQRRKLQKSLAACHLIHSVHKSSLLAAVARVRLFTLRRLLALEAQEPPPEQAAPQVPSAEEQREVARLAAKQGLKVRQEILLQVNLAREESKQGFTDEELPRIVEESLKFHPLIHIQGLMTMAPAGQSASESRRLFARLRQLGERLARPAQPLTELSMGMSGDFPEAILEGATLVRVGSALFEGLPGTQK